MRRFFLMTTVLSAPVAMAQEESVTLDPLMLDAALRDEREILDTPVAVSVRDREELQKRQASNVEELIGDMPGLTIAGGPRGISQGINIRGFSGEQVVLLFDGGRMNYDQGHKGRFFFDTSIIESVEVIRGGGSTMYGSGALGGVLAFNTLDPEDLLKPGQTVGGRVSAGYASNGDILHGTVTAYADWGAVDVLLSGATHQLTSDLEDGHGHKIRNSNIDDVNGLVKFGFEPNDDQRFELSFTQYYDDGDTPSNTNAISAGADDVDRKARNSTVRMSWDFNPDNSDLVDISALFYGNFLDIKEDRHSDGRYDKTHYDTYGAEIVNRSGFDMGVPVSLVYGVEYSLDKQHGTRNGRNRAQFPKARATSAGAFVEATLSLTNMLDLIGGLRYDYYKRNPDDDALDNVSEDFWSPRIGLSFRPTDSLQFYGNVSRAYRAPSLTELYNDGTHFAIGGFPMGPGMSFSGVNRFIPNPDLKSEKSTQVEVGMRFDRDGVWTGADRLSFGINGYYADVKDYVDQTVTFMDFGRATFGPTGMIVDGSTSFDNVDAKLWGLEAEARYDAGGWFAGAGLTIPRGKQKDGGGHLGSLPQERLTLDLGFRPAPDWEIGARAALANKQDKVPEGTLETESWQVVDLYASWQPKSGQLEGASLRMGVDNVLDEQYTIYPNGLPQPGRTFKVTAAWQF